MIQIMTVFPEGLYVSGDWYLESDEDALASGFISPYAMSETS